MSIMITDISKLAFPSNWEKKSAFFVHFKLWPWFPAHSHHFSISRIL